MLWERDGGGESSQYTLSACVELSNNKFNQYKKGQFRLQNDRRHLTSKINVCPVSSPSNGHFSKEAPGRLDKQHKGNKVITESRVFKIL